MTPYFDFSQPLRKMIYTNNAIESYHRNIRKMTKSKGAFTSDNALLKVAFLAIQNMDKIWQKTSFNWKVILSELLLTLENRINLNKIEF